MRGKREREEEEEHVPLRCSLGLSSVVLTLSLVCLAGRREEKQEKITISSSMEERSGSSIFLRKERPLSILV